MNKQLVLAVAAGTAAFAAVVGSAATLGGITSDDLGADTSVVASCDTDGITVDYTTSYDATAGLYEVTGVELGGIDEGCNGQAVKVSLSADASEATPLEEATSTVVVAGSTPGPEDTTHALTFTGVDAELVGFIAVVISG